MSLYFQTDERYSCEMTISPEQFDRWMTSREGEHLEFKEAKTQYDSKKLIRISLKIIS
jgi:hypothetical protein